MHHRCKSADCRAAPGECGRYFIVTIEPCALFGKIAHLLQILPERRNDQLICRLVIDQLFLAEDVQHMLFSVRSSKVRVDLLRLKRNSAQLRKLLVHIHICFRDSAAAEFFHQLAGAVHGSQRVIRIQSFLENCGSVRAHADSLRGFADICSVECCGLEKHCFDAVRDHRILAAHDAGDADIPVRVADHKDVGIKLSLLPVQCCEGFSVRSSLYDDLSAVNLVKIVRMHRLAILHHDKVRDVDQIVDRADTEVRKASLHPARGRRDFDVRADRRDISRAEILRLNIDSDAVFCVFRAFMFYRNLRRAERLVKGYCRFPRDAEHAVAVHAVRSNFILEICIVKSQCLDCIASKRQVFRLILRENIDAVIGRSGIHGFVGAELGNAAHHADRGKASHFAGFDRDAALGKRTAVMPASDSAAV